jgi:acyl-CoA synthetase (AMP-forming)/AMP-acid ligase II
VPSADFLAVGAASGVAVADWSGGPTAAVPPIEEGHRIVLNPMAPVRRAELLLRRDATLGTLMQTLVGIHGGHRLVTEPGTDGVEGETLDYREAADRVSRWAGSIRTRIDPGDRVLVATTNRYEQLLLCLAASRAGGVAVPINAQMRPEEIDHVTADCGARLRISGAGDVEGAEPLGRSVDAGTGDVAALFYTSGTTGRPKGAELTHRALVGQVLMAATWPSGLRHDEVVLSLPVAHIMGFASLLGLAVAGIPVYFIDHFKAELVLDALEERRSSGFIGVPAMYRMLLEAGAGTRDLTSVRVWGSGADAMPGDLAQQFKRMGATAHLPFVGTIGEAAFLEAYGMVEVGGGAAVKVSPPMTALGLGGDSFGIGLPGYHLRVTDDAGHEVRRGQVGELWIKGPGVLRGYWNAPEATRDAVTDEGWLRTGDMAHRGLLGTVRFVGRTKDVIKVGGYSVYSLEVQTTLEEHPQVVEAVVLGLPDERLGQVPVAVVRLAEGASLDDLGLEAWAAERLARYKVPRRFVAVDELPRTGTKKVQKAGLLDLF